jgi:hypothetical protein
MLPTCFKKKIWLLTFVFFSLLLMLGSPTADPSPTPPSSSTTSTGLKRVSVQRSTKSSPSLSSSTLATWFVFALPFLSHRSSPAFLPISCAELGPLLLVTLSLSQTPVSYLRTRQTYAVPRSHLPPRLRRALRELPASQLWQGRKGRRRCHRYGSGWFGDQQRQLCHPSGRSEWSYEDVRLGHRYSVQGRRP